MSRTRRQPMAPSLIDFLRAPTNASLQDALAEGVCFHSPVADYDGRADVAHLLVAIASVLRNVREDRVLHSDEGATRFITARVNDEAISGILDERRDGSGRIVEATLLLRPYSALRTAIAQMQARLAADPLPSAKK